ncbi:MAG: ParB/RepB/Spo0J family partition protein [Pseudomonadota bacterium]
MADGRSKTSRLGKGLSALIGEVEAKGPDAPKADAPGVADVAISDIRANPAQPRRHFDDGALEELAGSIKSHGVLQAILVRPAPKGEKAKYQIIAGERRWRAAKRAGLETIPAVVREVDELQLLEQGIVENVQRTDLNPIEEALAYEALMQRFGRTQDGLAAAIGKGRVHIANTLRLLKLSDGARELVSSGAVSAGHARAALAADDPEAVLQAAVKRGLSVRQTEALAREAREDSPSDIKAAVSRNADKDPDTEALEADLTRRLGLDVDIKHGPKGGELRIKYRELEQLDEVCRLLTARRS